VKLDKDKSTVFHNLVAKTLFATKRARPDTCTAIAFLTTRVRAPTTDDWRKLAHLMKYLRGTRNMPLVLSADGSGVLKWWVDASFAVTQICVDILVAGFPWVKAFQLLVPPSKR
jgi:hypothetical protein